jgi:glycine cleavage system pyridoxal-binding protein P
MLKALDVTSLNELIDQTVPENLRLSSEDAFKHG